MRYLIIIFIIFLTACQGYKVREVTDPFNEEITRTVEVRLDKPMFGIFDKAGLYINPVYAGVETGLIVDNYYSVSEITGYNYARFTSGIGAIKSIEFLVDGELIILKSDTTRIETGPLTNNGFNQYSYTVSSRAWLPVSKTQLTAIANSKDLSVRLNGAIDSTAYQPGQINKRYRPALQNFLDFIGGGI